MNQFDEAVSRVSAGRSALSQLEPLRAVITPALAAHFDTLRDSLASLETTLKSASDLQNLSAPTP